MECSNINNIGNFREIHNDNRYIMWIFHTSQHASRTLKYDQYTDLFHFIIEGINKIETFQYQEILLTRTISYNQVYVTIKINGFIEIYFNNTINHSGTTIESKCVQNILELNDNNHITDTIIKPFRLMLKYILSNDDVWTQSGAKVQPITPKDKQLLTEKLNGLSNYIGLDYERLYLPEIII